MNNQFFTLSSQIGNLTSWNADLGMGEFTSRVIINGANGKHLVARVADKCSGCKSGINIDFDNLHVGAPLNCTFIEAGGLLSNIPNVCLGVEVVTDTVWSLV